MSTKEHEKRHRPRRSRSPRTSVFSRIRRERSKSTIRRERSRYTKSLSKSEDSGGGHWKSRSKKKRSSREEDDLSQPWVCEETDPFTPRIRYFNFPKTRMHSHIKTYDESEDLKDHLKIFQAAAKTERWDMPTWCHMFNSTLTGNARVWFDNLPAESIDSYDDLKNHSYGMESLRKICKETQARKQGYQGVPECMRISEFVHGITNPELIKCLHDKIPKTVDEMMRIATSFLWGEVAASNHERKKTFIPWKQHKSSQKQNFKKEIEEMLKAGKLWHLIKEIKQNNKKEQPKVTKKGETFGKDKALAILMVQPWERVARQRITQSFSHNLEIYFPPLEENEVTKGLMIIEAKIEGHCVHRMYVDGGSASEIMYEHCFSRLHSEIKKQLIPATNPLIGFSGEIIWPIRKIQLLDKVGDKEHSALAWMNFMVVRSKSPYNGIIGRSGVRKLQAVPSTAHGMRKILVEGGVITLKSSKLVPMEYAMVYGPAETQSATKPTAEERVKVVINLKYPKQTIGRNLKVYVDDCTKDEIVRDIEETFKTLREINMKLNPKKCAFRVEEGMFLGVQVNANGLKVCPDKKSDYHWTTESEEAFKQMKKLIAELPMLTAPMEKEELIVYLVATKETMAPEQTNTYKPRRNGVRLCSHIQANVDSRLVANQVNRTYVAKEDDVIRYLEKVKALTGSFKAFSIKQIPRSKNKKADSLRKIASTSFADLSKQVLVKELKEKSISEIEILAVVEEKGDTWMTPLFKYPAEGTLPADVKKATAIKRKSWRFAVVNETLYKKSFLGPWLRCIGLLQANYVLREIHEGSCTMHAGLDSLEKLSQGKQFRDDSFKDWRKNKSKVGCKKQELDRRATPCFMGTPHNDKIKQQRYPVLINIRNGGGHPSRNNESLEINLDLLEERREDAAIREAKSKSKMEKYYNSKVRNTSFKPRDLVCRNNDASRAKDTGKLGPKWEGPYEVTKALGKGAYKLRDRDRKQLLQTWNISNLKKCHIHKM
uniref:Reverse transcriptase domain-containing protein n=1 Tax=Tanacetum cinerariifolium TaxID=118510 RepID=A0A6L2KUQ9_TANCI|nr:reverse transcriptase domain-containing protein [Tanacetum cinerariifolium]